MKKYALFGAIGVFSLLALLLLTHNQVMATSAPTLTATTTVANVVEVKASRTIGVAALPADAETFTIGSCVVTFNTMASSTTDELNCNNNTASIDRTLTASDTLRTVAEVASTTQTLTNASSSGTHGALTITSGGTATTTTFTTTGTETSATAITFTDGTGNDIRDIASTTGVVKVAQVATFTPGNVTTGDVFRITINSTEYVYAATADTAENVVLGLADAMSGDTAVSCPGLSDSVLTCTAQTAGTAFTYDALATTHEGGGGGGGGSTHHSSGGGGGGGNNTNNNNTPTDCHPGDLFSTSTGQSCAGANVTTPVGCLPGFAFSTINGQACGSSNGLPNIPTVPTINVGVQFNADLTLGSTGPDVVALQTFLVAHGYLVMPSGVAMGTFGPLTQAALAKFQAAVGLSPAVGYFGPLTRAYMNSH